MVEIQRDRAEFNDALGYLARINLLFSAIGQAKIELNLYMWFHSLITLFTELSTYMKKDEVKKVRKFIQDISPEIENTINMNKKKGVNGIPHSIYYKLLDMELDLRNIYKDSGLQMKKLDEAEKALR